MKCNGYKITMDNTLATRKIVRGPGRQNFPPDCPNSAGHPNDFSLDSAQISRRFSFGFVALQIKIRHIYKMFAFFDNFISP